MFGGASHLRVLTIATAFALGANAADARSPETDAKSAMAAFTAHCFSPFLTAKKAKEVLGLANMRYDFYDLDPFSDVPPSPSELRTATPGTDRRCEVASDGDFAMRASTAVVAQLLAEGITIQAEVPSIYQSTPGTTLLAARKLNPRRVAVVHVGTRPGPSGTPETFMMVERLVPLTE